MVQRACVVSQRAYPGDARLSTQIKVLQESGYQVDVLCTRAEGQPRFIEADGVNIYRVPSLTRQRAGKLRYALEYISFLLPCLFILLVQQIRRGYKIVMVTNLPDSLVLCALFPKLFGAKVIFDVRECTPEMVSDRFGFGPEHRFVKFSVWLEQLSVKFADFTVTCTEQMRQILIKRGAPPNKVGVMLNVGAAKLLEEAAQPAPPTVSTDLAYNLVSHGTVIKRYGHETLIRAMPQVVAHIPHVHLEILGQGQLVEPIKEMVQALKLEKHVSLPGHFWYDELLKRLRQAHVGIIPTIQNPESDLSHAHKMYEYIALGIPVIISRTESVCAYFPDDTLRYVDSNDHEGLAQAIIELYENPHRRTELARNASQLYEGSYSPAQQKTAFAAILNGLVATK